MKQENEKHLLDVFQNLKSARERWNFINEIRNCEKTQTEIPRLKNSFGTVLTNGTDIANLLNYKFSALGEYFGKKNNLNFVIIRHATVTNLYSGCGTVVPYFSTYSLSCTK